MKDPKDIVWLRCPSCGGEYQLAWALKRHQEEKQHFYRQITLEAEGAGERGQGPSE